MLSSGNTSSRREHEIVKKCEGFANMLGKDSIQANRSAFPIRAWFFSPSAEIRVDITARRAAKSTSPAETRS